MNASLTAAAPESSERFGNRMFNPSIVRSRLTGEDDRTECDPSSGYKHRAWLLICMTQFMVTYLTLKRE